MKKLYRSNQDKMFAGVCAGIAEYYGLDSTLVRLAFVLITLAYGGGLVAYIVCAIIVPERPVGYDQDIEVVDAEGNKVKVDPSVTQKKTKQFIGIMLLVVGALMLFDKLFWWFDNGIIWSIGVIAVGAFLLMRPSLEKSEHEHKE